MQTYFLSLAIAFSSVVCFAQETLQIDVFDEGRAVSLRLNGTSGTRVAVTQDTLDDILAFDDVVSLSLFGTSTTDTELKKIASLKNHQSLDISYSSVTDSCAESIAQLKNLQVLKLEGTKATDAMLETVAKLPEISMLHLAKTKISDRGLKLLKNNRPSMFSICHRGKPQMKGFKRLANLRFCNTSGSPRPFVVARMTKAI